MPSRDTSPLMSIVVVVYDMKQQAMNTLRSLQTKYQQQVAASDYEVIVVENDSVSTLNPEEISKLSGNFRHLLRQDTSKTPVHACNEALELCRGQYIGMIIDGACMLTPGVLGWAKRAYAMSEHSLCMVPGYHLGNKEQQNQPDSYSSDTEQKWLSSVRWQEDGYRLFKNAHFSPGNKHGYFHPFMECSCFFASRSHFDRINGVDERFTQLGGGSINLHLLRSLGYNSDITPIVLAGEGNFHQVHGGVTTTPTTDREKRIKSFSDELNSHWDGQFHALRREPIILGNIRSQSLPWLKHSSQRASDRSTLLKQKRKPLWADDETLRVELKP